MDRTGRKALRSENNSKARPKSRIPEFKSRKEAARWFDTHDLANYQDEFKTVRAHFARNLSQGITIRFDSETLKQLRDQAHKKGIGPTTLARMWILEHLAESDRTR